MPPGTAGQGGSGGSFNESGGGGGGGVFGLAAGPGDGTVAVTYSAGPGACTAPPVAATPVVVTPHFTG